MSASIKFISDFCFNYAANMNKVPLIREIQIKNTGKERLEKTKLTVTSAPAFFEPYTLAVEPLDAGACKSYTAVDLKYDAGKLADFSEAVKGSIYARLTKGSACICEKKYDVDLQPFDECSNFAQDESLRAAFVTPNHPDVTKLITHVGGLKGEKYGSFSIVGYNDDRSEVIKTAECLFEAVKELEITYVLMKQGFVPGHQRIRLADEIMSERQANCLDFTCYFASVLEALSLYPLLIIFKDHACVGFWTVKKSFPQPVSQDKSLIRKSMAKDIGEMILFECTLARKGCQASFQAAQDSVWTRLERQDEPVTVIDVHRARMGGILPLPSRVYGSGWTVLDSDPFCKNRSDQYFPDHEYEDVQPNTGYTGTETLDKLEQWKNKLLDLTARSPLLNISVGSSGKGASLILTTDIRKLYEKVKSGKSFKIMGRPEDFEETRRSNELFMLSAGVDGCKNAIQNNLAQGILHTPYSEATTRTCLAAMRKKNMQWCDQKGASILYMTFGVLRWLDEKQKKYYQAPLLLVPVYFEKEGRMFKIAYTGGKIFFNAAVLELLRLRFDLKPAGVTPEPVGNDGHPCLSELLKNLRKSLTADGRVDIYEYACLGLFAFNQYLMWHELDFMGKEFVKHPVIEALMKGGLPRQTPNADQKQSSRLLLPLPADATQQEAALAAVNNEDFVMYGPPGTGKSQVITLILANMLAQDKTVLFAAEKTPALQVVYNRLKQLNLNDFCLFLPAENEKGFGVENFLRQLQTLMDEKQLLPDDYDQVCAALDDIQKKIKLHTAFFTETALGGHTLETLLSEYLRCSTYIHTNAPERETFGKRSMNAKLESVLISGKLDACRRMLATLLKLGEDVGGAGTHPLKSWKIWEYSYGMQVRLREALERYIKALEHIGVTEDDTEGERAVKRRPLLSVAQCQQVSCLMTVPENLRKDPCLLENLKGFIDWKYYEERRKQLEAVCAPRLYSLETETLSNLYESWLKVRWAVGPLDKMKKNRLKKQLLQLAESQELTDQQLTDQLKAALQQKKLPMPRQVSSWMPGLSLEEAIRLRTMLEKYFPNGIPRFMTEYKKEDLEEILQRRQAMEDYENAVKELFNAAGAPLPVWRPQSGLSVKAAVALASQWLDGVDTLRQWCDYEKQAMLCRQAGMDEWVDLYEQGCAPRLVSADFGAFACYILIQHIYRENPQVQKFAGYHVEHLVERYGALNQQFYAACAQKIRYIQLERIQKIMNDPQYAQEKICLKKMIESGGKGFGIRAVISAVPRLLQKLTPCIMVSPSSACMYLDPKQIHFNHLVLDEASQIQTCKAVGLIARCDHTVVAGDPRQMPPTNLFESSLRESEDFSVEDDQESILKDFIAMGMPEHYLKWHYRSSHESLIYFSNIRYYDGKMVTFPSADHRQSKVHMVECDGVYDRGKTMTNVIEARVLADELEIRAQKGDKRSYGIIAFNQRQQELISRTVERRSNKNPVLKLWLEEMEQRNEGLIVRNLESVQGDERDVIFFSTGYGKDKNGRFTMNFGPIGKNGGWRRLNVAITRARDEMVIFTSIKEDLMKITDSTPRGVVDLKNFLDYARKGMDMGCLSGDGAGNDLSKNGLICAVSEFLKNEGYRLDLGVGSSVCKVDLGVINPHSEESYMLGIIIGKGSAADGAQLYDTAVGQVKLFQNRGWQLLTLWPADWLEDPIREQKRILKALERDESHCSEILK